MSRDEKHRGPNGSALPDDPDAPPTEEEVAASGRLRDALEGGDAGDPAVAQDLDLVRSLAAAWQPGALDERAHAEMLDDLPTAEELALAAELRNGLETDALAVALRAAWSPGALDDAEHRAIVERAVSAAPKGTRATVHSLDARRARVTRVVVVASSSVVALAASVVLWISSAPSREEAPLARARSTQPLFGEPFKAGETSARIDRIAVARAADYRDNRFAKWGVK